ncbi:MAG: hypothetical protein GEV03_07700 [Streptosporangiales bacterium]|nr:hypothetical protein [Streptosporangiales bacterium]
MSSSAESGLQGERIERTRSVDGLPEPTGPYSWAVTWGRLLCISGLRGIDPATGVPVERDDDRLRLIFDHLGRILCHHGCSSRDVLATRVYVTDMARLRPPVNDAYQRFFGPDLPTRTIVEVSALNQGDSVEIEAVAALRSCPGNDGDAELAGDLAGPYGLFFV